MRPLLTAAPSEGTNWLGEPEGAGAEPGFVGTDAAGTDTGVLAGTTDMRTVSVGSPAAFRVCGQQKEPVRDDLRLVRRK